MSAVACEGCGLKTGKYVGDAATAVLCKIRRAIATQGGTGMLASSEYATWFTILA
jgi:hypothetical protein